MGQGCTRARRRPAQRGHRHSTKFDAAPRRRLGCWPPCLPVHWLLDDARTAHRALHPQQLPRRRRALARPAAITAFASALALEFAPARRTALRGLRHPQRRLRRRPAQHEDSDKLVPRRRRLHAAGAGAGEAAGSGVAVLDAQLLWRLRGSRAVRPGRICPARPVQRPECTRLFQARGG